MHGERIMTDEFLTVRNETESEVKVKGSRFIALLFPLSSSADFEQRMARERKKTYNATHHCYAYRLGLEDPGRFSDDGEPSGTAGKPIQLALISRNVTNAGIIVTRYFGGTKLGTGGLMRAYRDAADAVLSAAPLIVEWVTDRLRLQMGYPDVSIAMQLIDSERGKMVESDYSDLVRLTVDIRRSRAEFVRHELIDRSGGRIHILP